MGYTALIDSDGKIVLPQGLLDEMGVKPGAEVRVDASSDRSIALSVASMPASEMEGLVARSIMIGGHRTSMRLEPPMWDALEDICRREGLTLKQLCTQIKERIEGQARRRGITPDEAGVTLTSAVRVFIAAYYRRCVERGGERGETGSHDPFEGTPLASGDVESHPRPPDRAHRGIEAIFGIAGPVHRPVTTDEIDNAVRRRAAERFRGE